MAVQSIKLDVNKSVFSWAINRAGFTINDVVKLFPKFVQWETGEVSPTAKQLKDFSQKFHFPFGYFFLNTIPQQPAIIPMFRSFEEASALEDFNVHELVKLLAERQDWVSEYLKENGVDKNAAVGLYKTENNVQTIKNGILSFFNLEDGWQCAFKKPEDAIRHIVSLLEENNIFVTFNSVVNFDAHRPVPVNLCRGFCLVDDYAPFIFINSSDSKKAQLFTLIHEIAHIFISFSSGYGDFGIEEFDNEKERLCDKIAAELLVPTELFVNNAQTFSDEKLSAIYKVSEIAILRRKLDCGLIPKEVFFAMYNQLPKFQKNTSGGGDFYRVAPNRIGKKLLRCLNNAMVERKLTPIEAYHLAGVKGDVFTKLVTGVLA